MAKSTLSYVQLIQALSGGLQKGVPRRAYLGPSWDPLLSPYIGKYTLSYVQMAQGPPGRGLKIGLWEAYLGPILRPFWGPSEP